MYILQISKLHKYNCHKMIILFQRNRHEINVCTCNSYRYAEAQSLDWSDSSSSNTLSCVSIVLYLTADGNCFYKSTDGL